MKNYFEPLEQTLEHTHQPGLSWIWELLVQQTSNEQTRGKLGEGSLPEMTS